MAGIYIHIPFCKQACHYCDFHFSTSMGLKKDLVTAICREISLQKHFLSSEAVETIYFGGGTPSLLEEAELTEILDTIRQTFEVQPACELTLEANPDDMDAKKLEMLRRQGVNRLSIGIQSFHDAHLQLMNRSHNATQAKEAVGAARVAGFENISVDLIYAIPHPDHTVLRSDIAQALQLSPEHISAYCLTIEEKTAFGKWQKTGRLVPADEAFAAEQFELVTETLERHGYEQYEISNFAREGFYSRHNTSYWQQKKYLGIGPSAHSYNGQWRQWNVCNNAKYIKSLREGVVPFEKDEISPADAFNEYLLTSLRTKWGTSMALSQARFDVNLAEKKVSELALLQKEELLFVRNSTLYLTKKGKLLADEITSRLMVF